MTFLWAAYSVIWFIIFGYLFILGKRQNNLKKEIEFLKQLDKD
ncbi:MAG: CcmD family protein [Bacillota bacterium]|nr:CcmD family protein [Bacillota bacterium]